MKRINILVVPILIAGLCACKKVISDSDPSPPLLSFVLLNKQSGDVMKSTVKVNSLRIWTIDSNGQPVYLNTFDGQPAIVVATDSTASFPYKFFYRTSLAVESVAGSKTWYMSLNGKTDTLYYDAQKIKYGAPYQIQSILFNGQKPASNTALNGIDYYIFQRRY